MSALGQTNGNLPEYRFYVTLTSVMQEVFPLNFLNTTLVDELETNQIFYRRKFAGTLTFVNNNGGSDFDYFYDIETTTPCSKIYFLIQQNGVDYWEGYFSTTDGKFDLDSCIFEVVPFPDDIYTDILDKADEEFNILSINPEVTTRAVYGLRDVTYTHNRWLIDVLEYLANEIQTGATVTSTFFTAATNPVTLADNNLLYLTIAQKSDIIYPTSTAPSTTALLSWNQIMDILWGMFQVTWDYDPILDTINVEHISFWGSIDGLDLRNKLTTVATNKYSYLKTEMPKYEYFYFAEADNSPFVGLPIWYDSKCVNQDPKSNKVETTLNVTTDIQYIMSSPDAIADNGFVILCNYLYSPGVYRVKIGVGWVSNFIALNCHLSWENLHNFYFRHNRVLGEGYMNSVITNFWTTQKNKIQECKTVVCPSDDYDPYDKITTELGFDYFGDGTALGNIHAKVRHAELSPTGEISFSLVYGLADVTPTELADPKFIYITEEKGSNKTTYTANASEVTGADVTISITLVLEDVDGITCTTAAFDVVILSGNTTGTVDIPWCTPVATPAICITVLTVDDSDAASQGWKVYIDYDLTAHC